MRESEDLYRMPSSVPFRRSLWPSLHKKKRFYSKHRYILQEGSFTPNARGARFPPSARFIDGTEKFKSKAIPTTENQKIKKNSVLFFYYCSNQPVQTNHQ